MMGNISSWITIDNNNQVIIKDQVISFLVNINVPANTLEGFYSLFINFKALGADGSNHFFEHFTQNIIIDNSAPDIPTFTVSKDKYTVALYNIYSTDYFSAFYTNINGNSGYNGIKSYTVSILENDVNAADPQSFNATTKDYCDFKSLKANTQYKVVVDAYDLVGLKNSKFEYVLTPPAAPSGLNYTNTTYNSTRLNWISSPGATEYDVYKVEGIGNPYTYTKINASPIKTNYYAIAGLSPNILYKYCVVARGPAGESDRSANATVNTLALPIISGESTVCSGIKTYSLNGLVSGYTLRWLSSSNMSYMSANGLSASFRIGSAGTAWVGAEITSPTGVKYNLANFQIWIGTPPSPVITCPHSKVGLNSTIEAFGESNSATNFNWVLGGGTIISGQGTSDLLFRTSTRCLYDLTIRLTTSNVCGNSSEAFLSIPYDCSGGISPLSISPNPASESVYVEVPNDNVDTSTINMTFSSPEETYQVSIFNQTQVLVYCDMFYTNTFDLNIGSLPEGIYFIKVVSGNKVYSQKLIINR